MLGWGLDVTHFGRENAAPVAWGVLSTGTRGAQLGWIYGRFWNWGVCRGCAFQQALAWSGVGPRWGTFHSKLGACLVQGAALGHHPAPQVLPPGL